MNLEAQLNAVLPFMFQERLGVGPSSQPVAGSTSIRAAWEAELAEATALHI